MLPHVVVPIAEARAGLTRTLRHFRENPDAEPVVLGSRRIPEAVLVPFAAYDPPTASRAGGHLAVLDLLGARRSLVMRLAGASRIGEVRVFGSVARGEEREDSDIDLLVSPHDDASLFDLAQFEIDMETLFERTVDVVSIRSLDPVGDAVILAEARPL